MPVDKLTIKQEKYAQNLFAGMTQREAYKGAYDAKNMTDKQIDEEACKLAANPKVAQRIEVMTEELKERNMITVENILLELSRVAYANGSDFAKVVEKSYMKPIFDDKGNKTGEEEVFYKTVDTPITDSLEKNKLAAIAGIKTTKDGIEVKTNDKMKALELMGKYLGMFTEKVEAVNTNYNANVDLELDKFNANATEEEKLKAKDMSITQVLEIIGRK